MLTAIRVASSTSRARVQLDGTVWYAAAQTGQLNEDRREADQLEFSWRLLGRNHCMQRLRSRRAGFPWTHMAADHSPASVQLFTTKLLLGLLVGQ